MVYGDQMKYNYGDCINDTLTMSAELVNDLNNKDRIWITCISDQIEKCQSVAKEALNHFAYKLYKLLYGKGSSKNGIKDNLIRQYYFSIDTPFREWLAGIDEGTREDRGIRTWGAAARQPAYGVVQPFFFRTV